MAYDPVDLSVTPNPLVEPEVARPSAAAIKRSYKIDLNTFEIVIENGQPVWLSGLPAIRQAIFLALSTHLGEWFLDGLVGVDWRNKVLGKNTGKLPAVEAEIRRVLLAVPGVLGVTSLATVYDGRTRNLAIDWTVSTDLGELEGDTVI